MSNEKTRFIESFARPYFLLPIGDDRLNIPLPDASKTSFKLSEQSYKKLKENGLPQELISQLRRLKNLPYIGETNFLEAIKKTIVYEQTDKYMPYILKSAISDYEQLRITIEGRNSLIHYSNEEVNVFNLVEKVEKLIMWLESENIFPSLVMMRYQIEYEDGTIRAALHNDHNEIGLERIEEQIEFKTKYYDMGRRARPRFIKYTDNWKEACGGLL